MDGNPVMVNTGEMPRLTPRPSGAEDRIAFRLRWERARRGWSTAEVARRMADAGTPVSQTAVWKIENGHPRRTISVDEAMALAKVFEVDSIEDLTRPPAELVTARLRQFAADLDSVGTDLLTRRARLTEMARDTAQIHGDLLALVQYSGESWPEPLEVEGLQRAIADMQKVLAEIGDELRNLVAVTRPGFKGRGWKGVPVSELRPIVAAIVLSELGVLVSRRNDPPPEWGFITGEIEPGEPGEHDELPEDAAVREVKEETGLEVRAGEVIGQRVHPQTGRTMIYIAARSTHGAKVIAGDGAELAEVRWVSLAEADQLLPDMYGPVYDYLARTLGSEGTNG